MVSGSRLGEGEMEGRGLGGMVYSVVQWIVRGALCVQYTSAC